MSPPFDQTRGKERVLLLAGRLVVPKTPSPTRLKRCTSSR
jgi:hypothetical protein